ncbi:hypothetical protein TTHERM_000790469 (macronuclear) [Tetrahymena thermophila SB210]|uniref:Uncharacterized protein n=1 Tax=Tetrahymena thermophila (strain SB210) TaxID=312017 RepID=W7X1C8_TETTS|nr:hypothetical protein TTHERM_000790469 [Tetrahymena thermophila SB210]EWS71392.1 hypothetical protein TTHERM_000790469 [Tetrahymena thermophila SB210]|eukprot:XP_012656064.1 hypothetical protein TTHERM_000790469 [Tetrahymena thermophila SB210]
MIFHLFHQLKYLHIRKFECFLLILFLKSSEFKQNDKGLYFKRYLIQDNLVLEQKSSNSKKILLAHLKTLNSFCHTINDAFQSQAPYYPDLEAEFLFPCSSPFVVLDFGEEGEYTIVKTQFLTENHSDQFRKLAHVRQTSQNNIIRQNNSRII